MKYSLFLLILMLVLLRLPGCSFLPVQSKPDVPSDHTDNRGGFLHKTNPRNAEGCECHSDGVTLHGGVYFINGRNVVTQSCYQCHGVLWTTGPGSNGGNKPFKFHKPD